MYCFSSYKGDSDELDTTFGTKEQVKALYIEFIKQFHRGAVMDYAQECGWKESYNEILDDTYFIYCDSNGSRYHAWYFPVKGTNALTTVKHNVACSFASWRKKIVRGLISFLKKYE